MHSAVTAVGVGGTLSISAADPMRILRVLYKIPLPLHTLVTIAINLHLEKLRLLSE